jgi:hypothetical protein
LAEQIFFGKTINFSLLISSLSTRIDQISEFLPLFGCNR